MNVYARRPRSTARARAVAACPKPASRRGEAPPRAFGGASELSADLPLARIRRALANGVGGAANANEALAPLLLAQLRERFDALIGRAQRGECASGGSDAAGIVEVARVYEEEPAFDEGEGEVRDPEEAFAEKVARRKRTILKAIADYDPQLVRLIDEQRFQGEITEVVRPKFKLHTGHNWEHHRQLLLKFGYVTTVVLIVLLIYLGFIQSP